MGVAMWVGVRVTWSNSGMSSLTPFSSRVFRMSRTRPTCFESVRFQVYDCACALNAWFEAGHAWGKWCRSAGLRGAAHTIYRR